MNVWDILVIALLLGVTVWALISSLKPKKRGCCGSCSGCMYQNSCPSKMKKEEE